MLSWLEPISEWLGCNSNLIPLFLFAILVLLLLSFLRG